MPGLAMHRHFGRRSRAAAGVGALGLVLLVGCDKPAPGVTIVSQGQSVRAEAARYTFNGKARTYSRPNVTLSVREGAVLGIDVDKQVADAGWAVKVGDQQVTDVLKDKHHTTVTVPPLGTSGAATLVVGEVPRAGQEASGLWIFTLRRRS
jgi:hypothetical protein